MKRIPAAEAARQLAALLDRVEHGESFEIEREGQVVARLVPAQREVRARYLAQLVAARSSDAAFADDIERAQEAGNVVLGDDAERRRFGLDEERWSAFVEALDAPVRPMPRMEQLLGSPSIFRREEFRQSANELIAAAYARGRIAREALRAAEGGLAPAEEVARMLGLSLEEVELRRHRGCLLALAEGDTWLYPRWQLAEDAPLQGVERVLSVLCEHGADPWAMMIFFLHTETEREGETPLAALRAGRLDAALRAARMYGAQGAR